MAGNTVLGRRGEDLAVEHLIDAGYAIVERNWRTTFGEIDIVAREGRTTVMVEVKTRSGLGFGHPFDAITPVKLARLRRLAAAWCDQNGPVHALRIDIVGVIAGRNETTVEHLKQVS